MQSVRQRRFKMSVARQDFRVKRSQRDVVKRQADLGVRGEKLVRRLVERIVEDGIARRCHVGTCLRSGGFGKKKFTEAADTFV